MKTFNSFEEYYAWAQSPEGLAAPQDEIDRIIDDMARRKVLFDFQRVPEFHQLSAADKDYYLDLMSKLERRH